MGGKPVTVFLSTNKAAKLRKWKVKEGMLVSPRQVIFLYDSITPDSTAELVKYKCMQVGTVRKLIAKEGDVVQPGDILLELEECTHPTVMKDMCAECGADLRKDEQITINASVPMVHSIPELKVSEEQAQIIGKADENRLINDKKLVLLVDLDQTLIHTTNDNIPPNLKDVYHFQLYGPMSPWYHTRIRPRTHQFLEEISKFYELHICTFGARNYAHMIAMFLDPDGKYFSHRILSRDECFNANSKTANLKALFPCGDNMVCIIDDREDVWNYAPNLIHVKPYHFFQHTGDINAPPGLTKKENDEIDGFDFSKLDKLDRSSKDKKDSEDKNDKMEKKIVQTNSSEVSKTKIEILGESTTDKDTEDEADESLPPKTSVETKPEEIEKITGDLQLSEDDSDDCKTETSNLDKQKHGSGDALKPPIDSGKEITGSEEKEKCGKNIEGKKTESTLEVNDIDLQKSCIINAALVNSVEQKIEHACTVDTEQNPHLEKNDCMERDNISSHDSKPAEEDKQESKETTLCLKVEPNQFKNETEDLIEVEDTDDYLMYLEDILKLIHKSYYELYDSPKGSSESIPDLKEVIPNVKQKVLKDCNLVFSGIVPSHVPLQQSRAYMVAISLGATVSPEVTANCTHLVAARPGTAKVNSSRRHKGILIVTPLWLWHCAERWEHLDERLYPLGRSGVANRVPPAHCGSPEHNSSGETEQYSPALRARTPSGRFIDTINPLLTFSSEDMKIMDQEVEDLFKDDDDDDETESEVDKKPVLKLKTPSVPDVEDSSTTSSDDSLSGRAHPKGWCEDKRKSRKRKAETTTCTESEYDEESPSVKFRRGEPLPSDLDLGEDSQDTPGSDEPLDDVDDGDWNMMGAALEREFLSGE